MILDEQKHKNLYRRYYQGRIKDYDSSKAKEHKEQEKAGVRKMTSGLLRIGKQNGISDEQIKGICVNIKTLTLTKVELEKAVDECIEDFNKPSDL